MGLSLLESLRKLIRQDNSRIGGTVGNLHGAVVTPLGDTGGAATQTWLVLSAPGRDLVDLPDFFDVYSLSPSAMRLEAAVGGELIVTARSSTLTLLRTVVHTDRGLTMNLEVGVPMTGAVAAVYVDGVLVRTVRGNVAVSVSLSAGTHSLYILAAAPQIYVSAPKRVVLVGETDMPRAPQWVSLTTGYLDAVAGTSANLLRWAADAEVGGYRVLRREPTLIGDPATGDGEVLEVSGLGTGGTFTITLTGDHSNHILPNAVLLTAGVSVGVVALVYVSEATPDETVLTCRLPVGLAEPMAGLVGGYLQHGTFSEIARITRVANTAVVEYKDGAVGVGREYEYALQATGLVDEAVLSPLSEVKYIVTGDHYPPGPIVLQAGYPKVINGVANVRFTTPADEDYAGVNVYFRDQAVRWVEDPQGDPLPGEEVAYVAEPFYLSDVTGAVVTVDYAELDEDFADFSLYFVLPGLDNYLFAVVSNTAQTLTLTEEVPEVILDAIAAAVTPIEVCVYTDRSLRTDFGTPNRRDELTFVTDDYGLYYFATFDRMANEQVFSEAVQWEYNFGDDLFVGQPVLALRQLTQDEQEFFAPDPEAPEEDPDYSDSTLFAILELWAYDPGQEEALRFEGVTIY
jgi:hypothetical protein